MHFYREPRPQISRTKEGEYFLHSHKEKPDTGILLPQRMARLIQKAQALEEYIPDVLSHASDDPEHVRELALYHRLNCHVAMLLLVGRLQLKDIRRDDLKSGEKEALAISDAPFRPFPYFTAEEMIAKFSDVTEENVHEFMQPPEFREEGYGYEVRDYLESEIEKAKGGPCVVQVGKRRGDGVHLLHSFVMVKTKTGDLFTFGKEGFTDPSLSKSGDPSGRKSEDIARSSFQFVSVENIWKYYTEYVSEDALWRVIPVEEISLETQAHD